MFWASFSLVCICFNGIWVLLFDTFSMLMLSLEVLLFSPRAPLTCISFLISTLASAHHRPYLSCPAVSSGSGFVILLWVLAYLSIKIQAYEPLAFWVLTLHFHANVPTCFYKCKGELDIWNLLILKATQTLQAWKQRNTLTASFVSVDHVYFDKTSTYCSYCNSLAPISKTPGANLTVSAVQTCENAQSILFEMDKSKQVLKWNRYKNQSKY